MNDFELSELYDQVQKMEARLEHIEDICRCKEDGEEKDSSEEKASDSP